MPFIYLASQSPRRRQLLEMRVAERNRLSLGSTLPAAIRRTIEKHIRWLTAQVKELDGELDHHLRHSRAAQPRAD